jgi:hypothetical protein
LSNGKRIVEVHSNPVYSFRAGYAEHKRSNTAGPAGFTKDYWDEWQQSIPFFQAVDHQFKVLLPEVHRLHAERVKGHPWTVIPGTGLSSVAINIDYASHGHVDRGDFKDGWSTLAVIETKEYKGGYYVFLEYGLAVDIRDCDLLLSQSHKYFHGNTGIIKQNEGAQRLSIISYLSDRLVDFDENGQLAHRRTGANLYQGRNRRHSK